DPMGKQWSRDWLGPSRHSSLAKHRSRFTLKYGRSHDPWDLLAIGRRTNLPTDYSLTHSIWLQVRVPTLHPWLQIRWLNSDPRGGGPGIGWVSSNNIVRTPGGMPN